LLRINVSFLTLGFEDELDAELEVLEGAELEEQQSQSLLLHASYQQTQLQLRKMNLLNCKQSCYLKFMPTFCTFQICKCTRNENWKEKRTSAIY